MYIETRNQVHREPNPCLPLQQQLQHHRNLHKHLSQPLGSTVKLVQLIKLRFSQSRFTSMGLTRSQNNAAAGIRIWGMHERITVTYPETGAPNKPISIVIIWQCWCSVSKIIMRLISNARQVLRPHAKPIKPAITRTAILAPSIAKMPSRYVMCAELVRGVK